MSKLDLLFIRIEMSIRAIFCCTRIEVGDVWRHEYWGRSYDYVVDKVTWRCIKWHFDGSPDTQHCDWKIDFLQEKKLEYRP